MNKVGVLCEERLIFRMKKTEKTGNKLQDYIEENPFMLTKDAVYLILRQKLLKDQFPSGKRINVSLLSDQLKVSRTPICNALDTLEKRGLVYRKDGKPGYFPFEATRDNIEDLFYARKVIEGHATFLFTLHRKDADLNKLRDLAMDFKRCFTEGDFSHFDEIDMGFHQEIVRSCKNHYLGAMYESINDTTRFIESRMRNILMAQNFGNKIGSFSLQHVNIYYAIKMGFASLAMQASDSHIDSCVDFIRRYYDDY